MKKVIILLFFLILGGAAFFLGWAQFAVPPGSYGVLRSKTYGIDDTLIREGEFRWVWYKLIPGNVTIAAFRPREITVPIEAAGELPSGTTYAAALGLKTGFAYEIAGTLSFTLRPDALPGLVKEWDLVTQEDLDAQGEKLAGELKHFTLQRLLFYGESENALEQVRKTGVIRELDADIRTAYPAIENLNCAFQALRFPDYELYHSIRSLYEEYLARQHTLLQGAFTAAAAQNLATQFRLDELSKYGELLTKYPILIQYLALERGIAAPPP
jgi:hypothetical protein